MPILIMIVENKMNLLVAYIIATPRTILRLIVNLARSGPIYIFLRSLPCSGNHTKNTYTQHHVATSRTETTTLTRNRTDFGVFEKLRHVYYANTNMCPHGRRVIMMIVCVRSWRHIKCNYVPPKRHNKSYNKLRTSEQTLRIFMVQLKLCFLSIAYSSIRCSQEYKLNPIWILWLWGVLCGNVCSNNKICLLIHQHGKHTRTKPRDDDVDDNHTRPLELRAQYNRQLSRGALHLDCRLCKPPLRAFDFLIV